MARQVRIMYWRCSRCGRNNQVRTMLTDYEPSSFSCENCHEESMVDSQDFTDTQGRSQWPRRSDWEE